MEGRVNAKGQITIPKALRDSLGLRPGTRLRFEERGGAFVARKIKDSDALQSFVGVLKGRSDAWLRETRGSRWSAKLHPARLRRPRRPR